MRFRCAHRRSLAGGFARVAALACAGLAVSCGNRAPASVAEIKAEYAQRLAHGAMVGMTHIEADRVDPATNDLIHVRIEAKGSVYAADRGEIIVDTLKRTVRLRLTGVVGASEDGALLDLGDITTPPARLNRRVSDAIPPAVVDH